VGNPLSLTFDAADPERRGPFANRRRTKIISTLDEMISSSTHRRHAVSDAGLERP